MGCGRKNLAPNRNTPELEIPLTPAPLTNLRFSNRNKIEDHCPLRPLVTSRWGLNLRFRD